MKKLLLAIFLVAAIFGGTFAAWHYGVVNKALNEAVGLVDRVMGRESAPEQAAVPEQPVSDERAQTRGEMLSAMVAPQLQNVLTTARAVVSAPTAVAGDVASGLRPAQQTGAQNIAEAVSSAPIDVATQSSRTPMSAVAAIPAAANNTGTTDNPKQFQSLPETGTVQSSLAPAQGSGADGSSFPVQTRPSPQQQLQAQVMASAATRQGQGALQQQQAAARQGGTDSGAAAIPALSEAKAQMRVVDQLLASDPAEAMRRINDVLAMTLEPDDAAEAGYRKGYAARMLRDEATAETAWRETAEKFPALRGGRYSALALGDTLYHKYAGERSQTSYWDDISLFYSSALGKDDAPFLPLEVKAVVKEKLTRINDSILFGSAPTKLARYHRVDQGELLGTIANRYRIDYESIARVNSINPNRIRVGMDLKLIVGDVAVVVRKNSANPEKGPTITWFIDGRWAREYPACVGEGVKTPPGTYTFTSKERDPSWTNPTNGQLLPNDHPENILGSRWMAMKGMNTQGLGIHGTTVDDSIPGYTSAGCVRLLNKDVEELFSFARIGGTITVID